MARMKTLIFDFDGTIADSFGLLVEVFETITKRRDKFTPDEIEKLRSLPVTRIIRHLGIRRWQIPRLLVKGRKSMAAHIREVDPIKELPPVLKQLHKNQYKMLILSTNSSSNISAFLTAHGLAGCFDEVYGGAGIFNKAAALKKIIRQQRLNRDETLYIGDEIRDIQAAKKAGLKYISVGWGFNSVASLKKQEPMVLIEHPLQLPDAIEKLI